MRTLIDLPRPLLLVAAVIFITAASACAGASDTAGGSDSSSATESPGPSPAPPLAAPTTDGAENAPRHFLQQDGIPLVRDALNQPSVLRNTRWGATHRDLPYAEMIFSDDVAALVGWDGSVQTLLASYEGSWRGCASRFCVVMLNRQTLELSTMEFRVHNGELVIGECAILEIDDKHRFRRKYMAFFEPDFDAVYTALPPRICRRAHSRGYAPLPLP